jgi:hypothetical protein
MKGITIIRVVASIGRGGGVTAMLAAIGLAPLRLPSKAE